jgi:hypothetical protein
MEEDKFNPEIALLRRRSSFVRLHMADIAMGLEVPLTLAERLNALEPDTPPEMEVPD